MLMLFFYRNVRVTAKNLDHREILVSTGQYFRGPVDLIKKCCHPACRQIDGLKLSQEAKDQPEYR